MCVISAYYYGWIAAFSVHYDYISKPALAFELMFLVNIGLNFLKQYTPDGETIAIKKLSLISKKYFKDGSLIEDCIMVFPMQLIFHNEGLHYHNYWYLIKVYRIQTGLQLFDVKGIMDNIRGYYLTSI